MLYKYLNMIVFIGTFASTQARAVESFLDRTPSLETLHEFLAIDQSHDEWERRQSEHQQATSIFKLSAKARRDQSTPQHWQTLYKLASKLLDRALTLQENSTLRYNLVYDRYFIGESLTPPTIETDAARESLLRALQNLRDIAANNPNNPRRTEINFLIATTLARVGNDHCETYFKQLLDRPTASQWSLLSQIAYGDYLVSKGQFDKAMSRYRAALGTASAKQGDYDHLASSEELQAYIEYRLGWAMIQKNWQTDAKSRIAALSEASQAMQRSVDLMSINSTSQRRRLALKQEATRDLLWIWILTEKNTDAKKLLELTDQDEFSDFYREKVVIEAINKNNIKLAASTLDRILKDDPKFSASPDLLLRLSRAHHVAGNAEAAKNATLRLASLTSDPQNLWFRSHKNDPTLFERAKRMLDLVPLSAGMSLVRAAENENNVDKKSSLLTRGVSELTDFLKAHENHPQSSIIRLALASALIQLDRKTDALKELDTLYTVKDQDQTQRQAIATERLNLVLKLDAEQSYPSLPAPGEVKRPIALPELKRRLAQYAEDYMQLLPGDAQALALKFQIAQNLFMYGHYDDAMLRFESIVNQYPNSEQAKVAVEVLLSMNVKRARWDELIRLSTAFLNNRAVKGKALRDYVKQNLDYARAQKR